MTWMQFSLMMIMTMMVGIIDFITSAVLYHDTRLNHWDVMLRDTDEVFSEDYRCL